MLLIKYIGNEVDGKYSTLLEILESKAEEENVFLTFQIIKVWGVVPKWRSSKKSNAISTL